MNLYHLFVLFIVSIKFFGYSVFRHSVLDQMHLGVMAVDLLVKLQKLTLFVNTSKSSWGVRSRLYKPPISGDEATSQIVLKSTIDAYLQWQVSFTQSSFPLALLALAPWRKQSIIFNWSFGQIFMFIVSHWQLQKIDNWGLYYTTYYSRNLWIIVISYSLCT